MQNDEVIEIIKQHQFNAYEVKKIEEGLAILTDMPTGQLNTNNQYQENSIYYKVTDK